MNNFIFTESIERSNNVPIQMQEYLQSSEANKRGEIEGERNIPVKSQNSCFPGIFLSLHFEPSKPEW
jgi:hypothetical protein